MIASIRTTALLAAAAIGAGGFAIAPAVAGAPFAETKSIVVRHHDLDLASAQGAAELQSRVQRAIGRACGRSDTRDLMAMRDRAACRANASHAAQAKVELAIANARANTRLASAASSLRITAN